MAYTWGDHVGELELRVEAAGERGVFADAVRAFGELLGADDPPAGETQTREVAASGRDRALLLAGLLEELIVLAELEGFVPAALERLELGERDLRAWVSGRAGAPPHLVKAVTHHRLRFERAPGGGWRANALLDV